MVEVQGQEISVQLNPKTYNNIVNIKHVFEFKNPEEKIQEQMENKRNLLSSAKRLSSCKFRGN